MAGRTRLARVAGRLRRSERLGPRALGIVFLALLVGFGGLTYAFFTQAFTDTAEVTLETDHVGLELNRQADVKVRGLIVGEVRHVASDGRRARVDLALAPDSLAAIPANVTARIVPKTLFGEKYVELVLPPTPATRRLAAGDVIGPDRSSVAIELAAVLEDVYPLLRTLRPAQLNATLAALATALEGRGDRIGGNLTRLNDYLGKLDPHLPQLTHDVSALADVADVYADATPDLVRLLRNATKTGNTVVVKQRVLEDFLTDLAGTSASTRRFLADNEAGLIRVGEVSRPTLDLLATYSPEYSCLLEGLANWVPRIDDAFGGGEHYPGSAPSLHITLELVDQHRGYGPRDRPAYDDDRGPGCRSLPDPPYSQAHPAPGSGVREGVEGPGSSSGATGPGAAPVFDLSSGYAGTAREQRVVNALVAPVLRTPPEDVPDVTTLLYGPLLRGTQVSVG
ncbi:virulence factor Mce family protein [Actinopolymorpha cephalotaxi]|uniref:Virulence factor Mce family protein n=1 Tax=Actinopolymorpha cephalotaxi TaxID=504797 RepID=A0A1I2VA52_9ACTN|nr:MCE family protein [Actinopolymorpha cephalotaxi]NYH84775.1 virulence factor Mce-like protein [Actinopolymorpha cephalotaxi]SFG85339.1 virulence factor Mce family protein [Actinopolymorpha cephalotaxi]